ncbi:MAG: ABC transporter ATP-binding protein [Candidatus Methanoperedens nitroreducens]|uniref:ABC transporter ATP-binding protein n=1 Tax=Candidatus Methanoperedens nitratireducens TaxID=1392998 RepID=A0A0P8AF87_9EURY|nr:MAG: ABC transporter ATP-binding protein [Candidatus Methanoperedens sp. BLZ1]
MRGIGLIKMIIAKNLVKKYDTTCALKDASFTIEKGEWANIMGPSGSGKTTLLNLIGCLRFTNKRLFAGEWN